MGSQGPPVPDSHWKEIQQDEPKAAEMKGVETEAGRREGKGGNAKATPRTALQLPSNVQPSTKTHPHTVTAAEKEIVAALRRKRSSAHSEREDVG
ncbi:uncharacterized [Tachysurus ichikawai]